MGGPDQVKELRTGCGSSRRGASDSDPVTPQKLGTDTPTSKLLGRHAEAGMQKRTASANLNISRFQIQCIAFTPDLCRKLRSELQRATDRTDPAPSSRGGVQRANGRCCDGHEGPFIACSRFGSRDYSRTAVPWVLRDQHVSEEADPNLQGCRLVHDGNITLSDAGCIK